MKRALLFALIGAFSAAASFVVGRLIGRAGLVVYLTYPNLLLTFAVFLMGLYQLHKEQWKLTHLLPRGPLAWVTILTATGLLFLFEPFEFKIIYDEALLAVAAELLHFTRSAGFPSMGNDYDGSYQFLSLLVEKRPFFFSFLLSLVHDFTGYRYSNAFFLNGVLSFVLMILIHFLGVLFGGRRGGILAVILAASLPLLALMATSGNQEILNVVMLCLLMIFSWLYLKEPGEVRLVPLVYGLILFFQIRYENGIYLLPFGLLILMGWKKIHQPVLPWKVMISPLFLILPTIHYFIVAENSERYFQEGPNGRDTTFSLSYFQENVEHAGNFLFSIGHEHPNSILLTLLGLASCALFIYYILGLKRRKREAPVTTTVLLIYFLGVVMHLSLVFCFNFGVFNSYLTSRLSLPLQLLLIVAAPFAIRRYGSKALVTTIVLYVFSIYFIFLGLPGEFLATTGLQFAAGTIGFLVLGLWTWKKIRHPMTAAILVSLIYIITVAMPIGHAHRYSQRALANDTMMKELEFLEGMKGERILWISAAPYAPLLTQTNSLLLAKMVEDPTSLKNYLEDTSYDGIYLCRRFIREKGMDFGLWHAMESYDPEVFITEPVKVIKLGMTIRIKIDRLVDVIVPDTPGTPPLAAPIENQIEMVHP